MTDYKKLIEALNRLWQWHDTDLEDFVYGSQQAMHDAAAAIEGLQSEVGRLKDVIDELREAQTYIDHYGDKWLTSAKDVPTSAYIHGYMDGRSEAEQALEPKRGEIVRCGECKWYEADLCANPWGVCFHEDWVVNNIGHTVDEDGFCYRGERKVQDADK